MKKGIVFLGMGFELLALILGALYVGDVIDKHFGWPGYALATTVICALISWLYHLFVMLKKFMEDTSDDPPAN